MAQSFCQASSGALSGQLSRISARPILTFLTPTQFALEWQCALGCSFHDGHASLRRASQSLGESPNLPKNGHVAFISYCRSFMAIVSELDFWLVESLRPPPDHLLPAEDCVRQICTALGVAEDSVPVLLRSLPQDETRWRHIGEWLALVEGAELTCVHSRGMCLLLFIDH